MTMTDGSIASTGAGKLVLQGNVTTFVSSATATISGNLDLGGTTAHLHRRRRCRRPRPQYFRRRPKRRTHQGRDRHPEILRVGGEHLYRHDDRVHRHAGLVGTGGAIAVPSNITINGGIVRELFVNQIADTSTVAVNEPGIFELNGLSDTIGSLTVSGISGATTVNIGPGTLTAGSVTMTGGSIFSTGWQTSAPGPPPLSYVDGHGVTTRQPRSEWRFSPLLDSPMAAQAGSRYLRCHQQWRRRRTNRFRHAA